ncbi:MAG: hypothetical protein IPK83_07680 [Planctomycetes bacterium]|nr:hypothetical protein [Planctomycetota bacterium]
MLLVYPDMLKAKGITLEVRGELVNGEGLTSLVLNVSPDSTVNFMENAGRLTAMTGGELVHVEDLVIRTADGRSATIEGFAFSIAAEVHAGLFKPKFSDKSTKQPLLEMSAAKAGLYRHSETLEIEGGDIRIMPALAAKLGDESLAGVSIGDIRSSAAIVWAGGEEPVPYQQLIAEAQEAQDAMPRGGNGGTVCPLPVGPDVITGTLIDIGNYGTAEVPPGSGNWIVAFSVGTTSCNIGNQLALWDDDQPPPTNLHPVIAQNIFKLRTMPDGSSRFEQIGQSWLKHSFTVAAGDACGCGCTGPGGPQLHPGCSDPYGSGLNGSQGGLGPRWQVNPRTGEYPHPYQDGTHTNGDTNVWKRCQVKASEIGSANSTYWAEGIYITQDEQQAGNAWNNASYCQMTMTPNGINNWSGSNSGFNTIRMLPAIKAWKAAVPSVVETDIVMSPAAGEPFQNAREYMHLAANVTALPGGLYNYEYALYNLNSHRGVWSFSIPVPNAAQLSDVGFHDVMYHSGDGNNGTTRSATDWSWSHEDGMLTFSSQDFATNPNANALMWGVLFNFRFTCNIEPAAEQGQVALGLFRTGTPNSITVNSVVPEPSPVYIEFIGAGPAPTIGACNETHFDVNIVDGSDVYNPGSGKIVYSVNEGAWIESPMALIGGTAHRATLPAFQCNSRVRFYFSAQGMGGETATTPDLAPAAFFTSDVGVEEINTIVDVDFESGLPAGWTKTSLWNVTSLCGIAPACNVGSQWAYFGQTSDCTYDNGSPVAGGMSRSVTIPETRLATLTYCSNFEREAFGTADWPSVRVNGVVVDRPALGGLGSSPWVQRTVDMTPYAGQTVTVEWHFDSIDSFGNAFRGWQVDNIKLDVIHVACNAPAVVVEGDIDGNGLVDGRDVDAFIAAVMDVSAQPEHVCPADFSANGIVDPADVEGMVEALLAQP